MLPAMSTLKRTLTAALISGELMATTSTSGDSLDNSDDGSYIGDGSCDQNLENQDDTYKAVHDAHSSDEEVTLNLQWKYGSLIQILVMRVTQMIM